MYYIASLGVVFTADAVCRAYDEEENEDEKSEHEDHERNHIGDKADGRVLRDARAILGQLVESMPGRACCWTSHETQVGGARSGGAGAELLRRLLFLAKDERLLVVCIVRDQVIASRNADKN